MTNGTHIIRFSVMRIKAIALNGFEWLSLLSSSHRFIFNALMICNKTNE